MILVGAALFHCSVHLIEMTVATVLDFCITVK